MLGAGSSPAQTTDSGVPGWISQAVGPIQTAQGNDPRALAYVDPSQAKPTINVERPDLYTKPIAAHESTHVFQNSRNPDFLARVRELAPAAGDRSSYDYGGVAGLKANPQRSIGDYNHEQQAQMVQDLTAAQGALRPHMSPAQLQSWDDTKNALERPIRQLQRVPAPDHSLAERGDAWAAAHTTLDHPFSRLKGLFVTPTMPMEAPPAPEAPSAALGYANRSKLVR
jgi:hypothetical protein